jgi:hypothetical protein
MANKAKSKSKYSVSPNRRPIVTTYYGQTADWEIQSNRSQDPVRAVKHAFNHMVDNDYGAFVAVIYNAETSELWGIIVHNVVGEVRALFRRDPRSKVVITNFDKQIARELTEAKYNESVMKHYIAANNPDKHAA